ncbi:hypothetical protein JL722_13736 [Aureococcus anophagefferens]|nr:hypothetical protein JL722_13736 [Aureococcus anophagefferens]
MGDKDAAVTLDSAWYVALLVGFEACSASCTARALATCPFVCVVAAWELVGGVACALPFWAVGARAPPTLRCFPAGALGAGAALRASRRFAAAALGGGVAVPSFVALAATRRVVLASARDLGNAWRGSEARRRRRAPSRVAGHSSASTASGREHLCEHLASTRAALESLGSLAAMAPRPESYGGGFLALVAALAASRVVGVVAESRAGPASDGDVLATDGLTGEARDGDLEAQLVFLVLGALAAARGTQRAAVFTGRFATSTPADAARDLCRSERRERRTRGTRHMAAVAPAVVLGEKPRFKYRDPGRMAFLARQRHVTERKTRWSVPQVEEALRVRLVTNRVMARRSALDLDGSGSLCQVEIRKLLHLFNIELTDGDWKKCWAWMDMDGSGALDINEFFVRFGSDHGTMLSIGDELKHLSADGAAEEEPRRPSEPKSQARPCRGARRLKFARCSRSTSRATTAVDYNMFLQATHDDETLGCRPRVRSAKDDRYAHRMDRLMEELRKKKPAVVTKVHPDYVASTCEDGHMGAFVGTGLCGEYERMCMAARARPRVLVRRGRRAALAGEVPHGQRQGAQVVPGHRPGRVGLHQADEIKRLLRSFLINVSDDEFVKMLRFAGFAPGERVSFDRFRKAFGGDIEHLHEGGGIDWGVCEISRSPRRSSGICT